MPAKEIIGYPPPREVEAGNINKGSRKEPDSRINFPHGALEIKVSRKGFTTTLTFKSPDGLERIEAKRR